MTVVAQDHADAEAASRLADRIGRSTSRLLTLYPKLFGATGRSSGDGSGRRDMRRNDRPGPVRVEVLDAIAETNQVLLDLQAALVASLGGGYTQPDPAGYRHSARVVAALQWLHTNAAHLTGEMAIAGEVAVVLEGLVRVARRLLGLASAAFDPGSPCPQLVPDLEDPRSLVVCGGKLIVVVNEELALCRSCGERWQGLGQIEALGRQLQPDLAEAA